MSPQLQIIPDHQLLKISQQDTNFLKIDEQLATFGLTRDERECVYKLLAGILHLGNIEFESSDDDSCRIAITSEDTYKTVAQLLSIELSVLESNLIYRKFVVKGSKLRFVLHSYSCSYYDSLLFKQMNFLKSFIF